MAEWWRRRFGRHQYEGVIVGDESGNVTPLPFVRFRTLDDAQSWVARMNRDSQTFATHYEYRKID